MTKLRNFEKMWKRIEDRAAKLGGRGDLEILAQQANDRWLMSLEEQRRAVAEFSQPMTDEEFPRGEQACDACEEANIELEAVLHAMEPKN
jgi:hypothetical protein